MQLKFALAAAAALTALPLTTLQAAPQMLGLVADSGVQKLNCAAGVCTVEVSAICLQEERDIPAWGTAYKAVDPKQIAIVAKLRDGTEIRHQAGADASFKSARGSWAVTISIPQATLDRLGVTNASLAFDGRVALAPVETAGDPTPQTEPEKQAAVIAFRVSPEGVIGKSTPDLAAAHVMNEMINALPRMSLDRKKPAGDLWRKTFGDTDIASRPGMKEAAKFFQNCERRARVGDREDIKECLELGHDGFISSLNQRYWDSLVPGV